MCRLTPVEALAGVSLRAVSEAVPRQRLLQVLGLSCVGVLLLAVGLVVITDGIWSVGLVGAGVGLCGEAAFLAWRGYPLGRRPAARG